MTITTTPTATRRNVALVATRAFAGLLGAMQLAGAVFFLFLAPEEAIWLGPWVDVPVVGLLLAGALLKLTVSVGPALDPHRRIALGLVAVAIGAAVTLVSPRVSSSSPSTACCSPCCCSPAGVPVHASPKH
jgi:hypothetical protein